MNSSTLPTSEVLEELEVIVPPTEDELPYSDGMPMESDRHILQMNLLIETLRRHWKERERGFCGGNMFIYFNLDQLKNKDFRGPDFFAVVDAQKRERKSWVCWQEGLMPDVVLELLSASTAKVDKNDKKQIYEQQMRVPEYFWFHPFTGELAGFELRDSKYQPIPPDAQGRLYSKKLGLWIVQKQGVFNGVEAAWLRWMREDGSLVPTSAELADEAEFRAAQEKTEREIAEQATLIAEQKAQAEQAGREAAEQATLIAEKKAQAEQVQREAAEQATLIAEQKAQAEQAGREAAEQKAQGLAEQLRALEQQLKLLQTQQSQ